MQVVIRWGPGYAVQTEVPTILYMSLIYWWRSIVTLVLACQRPLSLFVLNGFAYNTAENPKISLGVLLCLLI